jgi:hypothetical protein
MITMDNGVVLTVGAGWTMPPGYPNYSGTWIEFTGTDGMLVIDDTHRDVILHTMANGIRLPISPPCRAKPSTMCSLALCTTKPSIFWKPWPWIRRSWSRPSKPGR